VNIPIQNIYYLLCYAWDKLEERDIVSVSAQDRTSLVDLFARVLINGTNHLIKRGYDRSYIDVGEETARLRGRICYHEAIRKNSLRSGRLPCEFDELSHNVIHNQIIRATMRTLLKTEGIEKVNRESLSHLYRFLDDIDEIHLSSRAFRLVQLHRNNKFYDFLLKICELIHDNLLISEHRGRSKFRDFVQDEGQMRRLFEDFVRNFYKKHLKDYQTRSEELNWQWRPVDEFSRGLLPRMLTDISLTSSKRKLIIDCKFTPRATRKNLEAEKLREAHLYQIHAYLTNQRSGPLTDFCDVMLLYPTVETPLNATYRDGNHTISIRTINLNQDWQDIHRDLLHLVA